MNEICRISKDRFDYINTIKYSRNLTILEKIDYLTYLYFNRFGYNLDMTNPRSFNEKLNWLKIFYNDPLMKICANKSTAPDFFRSKIDLNGDHIVKRYAVFNSIDEFTFNGLPNDFILKSNFSYKSQVKVNKDDDDFADIKKKISPYFDPRNNLYYKSLEYGYKDAKPQIICEKIIQFNFKLEFFVFNGEPLYYWIIFNDKTQNVCANFYTIDCKQINMRTVYRNFTDIDFSIPHYFNECRDIAAELGRYFPHVRVDFFAADETYFFSEMTFYLSGGFGNFTPMEMNIIWGEQLKLPMPLFESECSFIFSNK